MRSSDRFPETTDEELVRMAVAHARIGGRDAASVLFERYQDRVYLWCYRYAHEHEQALDLAQEVLLRAYRSLSSFRSEARFGSWLFAVTRNRCLSAVTAPRLLVDDVSGPGELEDPARTPEEELADRQGEAALLDLIRITLDPEEQEALWLRCFEKMPVDEITRVLRIRMASGARGVLQSARRKLRAALAARIEKEGG